MNRSTYACLCILRSSQVSSLFLDFSAFHLLKYSILLSNLGCLAIQILLQTPWLGLQIPRKMCRLPCLTVDFNYELYTCAVKFLSVSHILQILISWLYNQSDICLKLRGFTTERAQDQSTLSPYFVIILTVSPYSFCTYSYPCQSTLQTFFVLF